VLRTKIGQTIGEPMPIAPETGNDFSYAPSVTLLRHSGASPSTNSV